LAAAARRALRVLVALGLGAMLAYLSVPVVRNLLQLDGRQAMNTRSARSSCDNHGRCCH
jgi:hypothetical protein